MVSRRSTLALLSGALPGVLAGCIARPGSPTRGAPTGSPPPVATAQATDTGADSASDPDRPAADTDTATGTDPTHEPTGTDTATDTATDTGTGTDPTPAPESPADGWPPDEWVPDWTHGVSVSHVVGLDAVDDRLIVTATDNRRSPTTVVQSYEPDARSVRWTREVPGAAIENSMPRRPDVARRWGVTDAGTVLLSVAGREDERWTELHAIDPESGEVRWTRRRERVLAVRGIADGVAHVVARAFDDATTEHHHGSDTPTPEPRPADLLAVDLADGSVRWRRSFTGVGDVAADETGVYVAVMNRLVAVDRDGDRRWTVRGRSRGDAVYPGGGIVYHVTKPEWDQSVVRGVGRDGTVRWRRRFDADETVRHRERLYATGDGLAAVEPDGAVVWQSPAFAGRMVFSPGGETLYVRTGRRADAVGAVALADGTREWTFDPPMSNAWPESATDGTVVAGAIGETADGVGQPLYRVDAATGAATARYLDEDPITTQPLGDHVYVATSRYEGGGQVLALPV